MTLRPRRCPALRVPFLLGLLFAATPGFVRAACSPFDNGEFGQMDANCGGNYCYVVSPGENTAASVVASFWAFAHGDPAMGPGVDNGSWSDDAWVPPSGPGAYLGGNWSASPAIDGCIAGQVAPGKPAEIMVVALSDQNDFGTIGYFAVAAARRFPNAMPEYDFTFVAGGGAAQDIRLMAIPRPRITSSTRTTLTFQGPFLADLAPGFFADASLTAGEAVVGWRLYTRASPPSDRLRSHGWSPAAPVVPLGQSVTVPYACITGEIFYASTLVYDGGFESAHLSTDIRVSCRCADRDGDGYSADVECPPTGPWDCDDSNPNVYPGALETCDGIDDDCNSVVDDVALPAADAGLRLDKVPGAVRLVWSASPVATRYDVVSGNLLALRDAGGDYASATSACLGADLAATTVDDVAPVGPGDGVWYLLRAENCTGSGTYDEPNAAQQNPRDAGIAASGAGCP